jgi:hypothetical protein
MNIEEENIGCGRAPKRRWCIFINTFFQGQVPSCYDEDENPVVFAMREEAELEIIEFAVERIEQHLAGERDFDEAITIEEFVVPVEVLKDGTVRRLE